MMGFDSWIVEEKVKRVPELDIRAVYIRLLEQLIAALKEPMFPVTDKISAELVIPTFAVPTVIFSFLDTESPDLDEGEALAQLICYRDRREFLKELTSFGDEDYLKEFGLKAFI